MAHHSKFLSVNLNKSYGNPSSTTSGYGNGRLRSSGGAGGMVVLSRPRSSSGATAHKSASKLAVPPPVNLPSLRKEHERLDPASSKPSSGHSGSGLGPGHGPSIGWTKPGPSSGEQQSIAGDPRPQVFTEKAVILKGEDFPSLLATSASSSKQKQRQISEKSDGWEAKTELSSVLDMRPQLRSSALINGNVLGRDDGSIRIPYLAGQSRQEDTDIRASLPLVRLRQTSDWDDDERDRNHGASASDDRDGRLLLDGEAHGLLYWDSGRGDLHGRGFLNSKKVGRDFNSWRVTIQPNKDFSVPHELHVDGDLVGPRNSSVSRRASKESSHAGLSNGDKRDFDPIVSIGNVEISESFNGRVEVSNNWQRGKPFSSGVISKGPAPSGVKSLILKDTGLNFSEEMVVSNIGKSYVEGANWGGKGPLSSDAMLDLNAKVFRKKKEAMKTSNLFDPVRESFEAEIERVQQLQELERQRVMEEQARAMEDARREVEERERRVREEEERRRLLEEEAREAAWRAEQEKLEAARRIEEQRIAIKEEKKRILMEEERRKEAARQKLLELEARIAKRQTVVNAMDDRMKERDPSRDSDQAEREKTDRIVEPFTSSPSSDSSFMNRLSEVEFRTHISNVENYSFAERGRPENNWSQNSNSSFTFEDHDGGYPSSRHDAFCSKRGFHRKQFQGSDAPMPLAPFFKKGMSANPTETGQNWDRNNDCDQFNGSSDVDAAFGTWDHGHFSGSQLTPHSQRSFQNTEVEDLVSFSRVRHTLKQPRVPPPPSLSSSLLKNSLGATLEGPNSSFSVNSDAPGNPTGSKEESDLQIVYNCRYQQIIEDPGTTELLEGTGSSLLQKADTGSPIYDSQSSLSVSSPPSSPTQHFHDELDDCGGSPALTTSVEEENITFSDCKHMMSELDDRHMDSEITAFSHEEDDEWAVDNNEEMEGGDQDEVHDIYQEDNEEHECDAGNLQMENKQDDVDAFVEKPDQGIRNSSFGIIIHPQLETSAHDVLNEDFGHAEKTGINQGSPTNAMAQLIFANYSADILQSKVAVTDDAINASLEEKTDKEQEDVILSPITTADHPPDNMKASNPIESATSFSLSSSLCSVSVSNPASMDEVPVRFHFGLFSGPPLIPSPLPTIQIGSIQMPLPLHEQINSYGQMHTSHPPLFQFDHRNRYTPPISQSALPMAAQTLSSHPSALGHSYINQNPENSSSNIISQGSTPIKNLEKEQPSFPADNQPDFASEIVSPCLDNSDSEQLTALLDAARDKVLELQSHITSTASDEKKDVRNLFSPSANFDVASNKNFRSMVDSRRVHVWPHVELLSSNKKSEVTLKAPRTMPEIRGNRLLYNARNTGALPSRRRTEKLFANSYRHQKKGVRHFQGTEYRVKESDGARQMLYSEIFNHSRLNDKPNYSNIAVGFFSKNSGRNDPVIRKSTKLPDEDAAPGAQVAGADSNMSRANKKENVLKLGGSGTRGNFCGGEGILMKNGLLLEDDIDAPLRSGIVRIFNQPGIEASADGDGFVEVRSKRKTSNERRELRERETNPKYKVVKVPRRPQPTVSVNSVTRRSDMVATLAGAAAARSAHSDPDISSRRPQAVLEASMLPNTGMEGQTIPPIPTAGMNLTDFDANFRCLKSAQSGSAADKASDGAKLMPSLSFGKNIIAPDKASVPLGTWGTVYLNHKVIASAICQLDEASNPIESNPRAADKISVDDSNRAASTMTNEKQFFSSANHLDFPFAGEKIQFGAVALPPTLPSSSKSVSSGLWTPGSVLLNPSIIHNVPVNDNSRSSFFDKGKCSGVSCTHLDATEAEAEAAASAVAVAAISNDISVCTVGTGSTSENGTKGHNAPGARRLVDLAGQSASEESLVVTLPADLSVDTPHSLWPTLPSFQSSRHMLSNIAGPPPSPFPFFDPNPILGGAIFPYRHQDESTGPQAQPQQNATFGSVPTGTWSQCLSGFDSFYGSPAGFPAHFMSTGGLSGVHGHPQMVFYSHFAPVGQFGQVGLSYMGTTYIPTGKQQEWKHNSEAPTVNVNKVDTGNLNVFGQQQVAHVPTVAQHLSSESAVKPVNSPFPMFNLRPIQSSTEASIPGHWLPIPHPSPHSIRLSTEPEQFQSLPLNVSVTNVSSNVPQSAAADLPDELGLLDSTASSSANARTIQPSRKPAATNSIKNLNGIQSSANSIVIHSEDSRIGMVNSTGFPNLITQQPISPVQQHLGPIRKADQLKGAALKMISGSSEWRRRNTFPGKNHSVGSDKNISSTKMKQIYVAKSLSTADATSS
ncbi:hypothetical protein IEQ34_018812 [Dendrobium chrysotoxum]|uniref:Uncharacterized protein n=1 Tax=Dendrobium chrysotoxum TaxID=161865 RepID=A0AAV7G6Z1_DENCH|nr:hypothetical protein IEQ34_018812 [Dendrobium chrysotoxum]